MSDTDSSDKMSHKAECCYEALKNGYSGVVRVFCEKKVLNSNDVVLILKKYIENGGESSSEAAQILLEYAVSF